MLCETILLHVTVNVQLNVAIRLWSEAGAVVGH